MNYAPQFAQAKMPSPHLMANAPPVSAGSTEPEVVRELRKMERQLSLLTDTITTLSERLIPVTSMANEATHHGKVEPSVEVARSAESPLGTEIRSMTEQLEQQTSRLVGMMFLLRI